MTLSDKEMICCEYMNGMFVYPSKKVKEFISEYCEKLREMEVVSVENAIHLLKERAGDKLTKEGEDEK